MLFATEEDEQSDVQVPFQRPVVRVEYDVEDVYEIEEIVQSIIDEYDKKRIDEMLEEEDNL